MLNWLSGWIVSGVILALVLNEALGTRHRIYGSLILLLAASISCWSLVIAQMRGRRPAVDATLAGLSYAVGALSFLALVFARNGQDFPDFLVDAVAGLVLFGFVFGFATAKYLGSEERL